MDLYTRWRNSDLNNTNPTWLLKGENVLCLSVFFFFILKAIGCYNTPADFYIPSEPAPSRLSILVWKLETILFGLCGAMFISFYAWLRHDYTNIAADEALYFITWLMMVFNLLFTRTPLLIPHVVWPVLYLNIYLFFVMFIQSTSDYVIESRLPWRTDPGSAAINSLNVNFVLITWYVCCSALFTRLYSKQPYARVQFKPNELEMFIDSLPDDQAKKLRARSEQLASEFNYGTT